MLMSTRLVCVVLGGALVVMFLVGCDSAVGRIDAAAAQRSSPASAQASIKSGVYEVLTSGDVRMLVKGEHIPIPAISASAVPEWLREFDSLPGGLGDALRQSTVSKPAAVDRSLFPAGTRFISQAEIAAAFNQPLEGGWRSFRRQYNSGGWVAFSDVLVTTDALAALVYIETHCGDLCGQGSYICLHRTGPEAPWSIVKTIVRWIS